MRWTVIVRRWTCRWKKPSKATPEVKTAACHHCAEKSAAPEKNLAVIEGFVARLEIFPFDYEAAAHTGMIRSELVKAGTPIGPYDHMIAGHARSRGFTIVTNNLREFERVSGLRVEDWVHPD
ncbi:PIN domain-containing protein [Pseudomonas sp. MDT1-85]